MAMNETLRVDSIPVPVSASLLSPRGKSRALVVLGHGAGGSRTTESIVLLQGALGDRGVRSLAFNFPYAEKKRRVPDRMPVLEATYAAVLERARALRGRGERLVAGGRSMGGRVATHLAARGEKVDGLVLLGYPLHPANRPDERRDAHLPGIRVPLLFVSGTRDDLAERRLLEPTVAALGPRAQLHWIDGADHGLDLPRSAGLDRSDISLVVADLVVAWITTALAARRARR